MQQHIELTLPQGQSLTGGPSAPPRATFSFGRVRCLPAGCSLPAIVRALAMLMFMCAVQVFDQRESQDAVFNEVAKPVLLSGLEGYNGTVFAYGQTGSGKTFTITGGKQYRTRGIIPRAISTLFEEFDRRPDHTFRCFISYLEIYNESVYDLLDRSHAHKPLEEWDKIHLLDTRSGNLHLRDLRVYEARTEDDALNLLFLGNANRVTSETPQNEASSRSHCVFSFTIESRHLESDVVKTSKVHLVDLAGSERVSKFGLPTTRESRTRSKEGRYINLSLHYLQQVILALRERGGGRAHIPYRNSVLTSVLRDSLGGNCRTVFIATLDLEAQYVEESVQTCRFAQRCGMLSQDVEVNEERDFSIVAKRLAKENARLSAQLEAVKRTGSLLDPRRALTPEERRSCEEVLARYIKTESSGGLLPIEDLAMARECTALLRDAVRRGVRAAADASTEAGLLQARLRELSVVADEQHAIIRRYKRQVGDLEETIAAAELADNASPRRTGASASGGAGGSTLRSDADSADAEVDALRPELDDLPRVLMTRYGLDEGAAADRAALDDLIGAIVARLQSMSTEQLRGWLLDCNLDLGKAGGPRMSLEAVTNGTAIGEGEAAVHRQLLTHGGVFLKHGRSGAPHPRCVWVDPDLRTVQWRDPEQARPAGEVLVSSITQVLSGRHTPVFKRNKGRTGRDGACLSLVAADRTLDLEVEILGEALESGCSPEEERARDEWVAAFRWLVGAVGDDPRHNGASAARLDSSAIDMDTTTATALEVVSIDAESQGDVPSPDTRTPREPHAATDGSVPEGERGGDSEWRWDLYPNGRGGGGGGGSAKST